MDLSSTQSAKESRKKILLVRPDKAGDALKSLPALRALKTKSPDFEYHLLVSTHNESVFAFEPSFVIHRLPKDWEKLSTAELDSFIAQLPGPFFRAVHLPCDPFPENERLLSSIQAETIYVASWRHSEKPEHVRLIPLPENTPSRRDECENIALLMGKALGLDLTSNLHLHSQAPVLSEIDDLEARLVLGKKEGRWLAVCPFAGTTHRTHPLDNWGTFLEMTTKNEKNTTVFLVGSINDKPKLTELRNRCSEPSRVYILSASSFRALGAYLQRMDGVVAVDSGPLHLSRALGVPSLGFLSGGDFRRWYPKASDRDRVVPRGFFHRYPSSRKMVSAFRQWVELVQPVLNPY